jgi:glutathione peroxidase
MPRGQVAVLIVNTASACGFTPQFAGLEELCTRTTRDQGLVVLGFPCNQFGAQDPGSNDEIASFCQLNYGVSFPMMAKVDVNGARPHPLYQPGSRPRRPACWAARPSSGTSPSSWSARTAG